MKNRTSGASTFKRSEGGRGREKSKLSRAAITFWEVSGAAGFLKEKSFNQKRVQIAADYVRQ